MDSFFEVLRYMRFILSIPLKEKFALCRVLLAGTVSSRRVSQGLQNLKATYLLKFFYQVSGYNTEYLKINSY